MDKWPVFVTDPGVDEKALNKAFLFLRDFEFTEEAEGTSSWVLIPHKTLLEPEEGQKNLSELPITTPPLSKETVHAAQTAFANYTLDDVNSFIRDHEDAFQAANISHANWLVIDAKGFETETAIVCDQIYEYDEKEERNRLGVRFSGARLPYIEVWAMFANLNVGNMDFEGWVDEDAGKQDDGTWKWIGTFSGTIISEDVGKRREEAMAQLREMGHVD